MIATFFASGPGSNPQVELAFLSPVVTVTIAQTSQKVFVTASKSLGSSLSGGASQLNLYICYRLTTGTIASIGDGIWSSQVPQNTRLPFNISGIITNRPAGTYEVGMCGTSATPANWNLNEWGYVSAIVMN